MGGKYFDASFLLLLLLPSAADLGTLNSWGNVSDELKKDLPGGSLGIFAGEMQGGASEGKLCTVQRY